MRRAIWLSGSAEVAEAVVAEDADRAALDLLLANA
jgi:hypothetical protein